MRTRCTWRTCLGFGGRVDHGLELAKGDGVGPELHGGGAVVLHLVVHVGRQLGEDHRGRASRWLKQSSAREVSWMWQLLDLARAHRVRRPRGDLCQALSAQIDARLCGQSCTGRTGCDAVRRTEYGGRACRGVRGRAAPSESGVPARSCVAAAGKVLHKQRPLGRNGRRFSPSHDHPWPPPPQDRHPSSVGPPLPVPRSSHHRRQRRRRLERALLSDLP